MSIEKELIWVSKETAEQFKKLDNYEAQEQMVKDVINNKRIDISRENEMLDDALLVFKGVCLSHKKELEKVYSEQSEKLYKLWEEMGDVSSMVSLHAKSLADETMNVRKNIDMMQKDVANLRDSLNKVNVYGSDQIIGLAKTVTGLDEATKELLGMILRGKS